MARLWLVAGRRRRLFPRCLAGRANPGAGERERVAGARQGVEIVRRWGAMGDDGQGNERFDSQMRSPSCRSVVSSSIVSPGARLRRCGGLGSSAFVCGRVRKLLWRWASEGMLRADSRPRRQVHRNHAPVSVAVSVCNSVGEAPGLGAWGPLVGPGQAAPVAESISSPDDTFLSSESPIGHVARFRTI
jgi:hypothetical protein